VVKLEFKGRLEQKVFKGKLEYRVRQGFRE